MTGVTSLATQKTAIDQEVGKERHRDAAGSEQGGRCGGRAPSSLDGDVSVPVAVVSDRSSIVLFLLVRDGQPLRGLVGPCGCHTGAWPPPRPGRQRGDDVGELDGDEVGADELSEAEHDTDHQGHRPDLADAATTVSHEDEDQGHEQREEGGLAADDGADVLVGDPGQRAGGDDRDGHRTEGHRRGVGQQDDHGGAERGEADRDQHHPGDRGRGAEACQRLQQAAETEGDDDRLDPRVLGDQVEGGAQVLELATHHRQLVQEERAEDDPHDREETEHAALGGGQRGPGRTGMPYASTATATATATAVRAATWAFQRSTPRVTKTVTSGSAATSDDSARLSAMGARSGEYIALLHIRQTA